MDVLTAGSPCVGFSSANINKDNDDGRGNQSLVASVATFVDFYRPKYGIFENVLGMSSVSIEKKEADVFSQVICALVGMGYQVQQHIMDSWLFGDPQKRQRLVIMITAPGLVPLPAPVATHSHPPQAISRSIGLLSNG